MDVWFHARVVVNAKIEWDISLLVEIVFCCLFIFMPFSLKAKSLQSLNATRWCEYSASDRRAWTAEVKCTHPHTFLCTSAHTYTSTFSSVVLPTDFPSSCKNSAVFGEINALVLLMQSLTHRRVVEHLWRNSSGRPSTPLFSKFKSSCHTTETFYHLCTCVYRTKHRWDCANPFVS